MKHLKHNLNSLFLAVLVLLTAMVLSIPSITADDPKITNVRHEPAAEITSDDTVTIYITVDNKDNITSVEYQYCEVDPVGTCSIFAEMTEGSGNQYTAVIPKKNGGTTMGYKIKIEFDDERDDEYSPNKDNYHQYYIEKDPEGDDDSPFIPFPMLVGAVLMATVIIKKRT